MIRGVAIDWVMSEKQSIFWVGYPWIYPGPSNSKLSYLGDLFPYLLGEIWTGPGILENHRVDSDK